MSRRIGLYNHLGVNTPLDLAALADTLVDANYGVHQMCSALVKAWHRKNPHGPKYPNEVDYHLELRIEKLLEEGCF